MPHPTAPAVHGCCHASPTESKAIHCIRGGIDAIAWQAGCGDATSKRCERHQNLEPLRLHRGWTITEYVELSRKLLDTLTEAISIDVQGGEEKEVCEVPRWLTRASHTTTASPGC